MKKNIVISLFISQSVFIILLPVWIELTKYLHPIVIGVVWFLIFFLAVIWCMPSKKGANSIFQTYPPCFNLSIFYRVADSYYFSDQKDKITGPLILFLLIPSIFIFLGNVGYLIALYNLGANIGLFIPFGLYYRYIKKTPSMKPLLLITIFSIGTIEWLQFFTKRGSLDIDDLILNVLGVCLGYFIYPVFLKVLVMKEFKIIR